MVCSLLAGCDGIPDPQNILGEDFDLEKLKNPNTNA